MSPLLSLTLLYPTAAHALTGAQVVLDGAALFHGTTAAWAPNGFGSPVVTWDPVLGRWHAVMEYQSGTSSVCPHGVWGLAWSTTTVANGASGWTTPVQVLTPPQNGSYYGCVAAHPAALSVDTTLDFTVFGVRTTLQALNVYFKAESTTGTSACTAVGANQQNCVYTGIGRTSLSLNYLFGTYGFSSTFTTVGSSPMIALPGVPFGFQSPLRLSGPTGYLMMIQRAGQLWQTTSTNLTTWTAPTLKLDRTAYPGSDELFNPELMCASTAGTIESFTGWRDWGTQTPGTISSAGWNRMTSTDRGVTWTLDQTPIVTWTNQTDWRHWSSTRVGPDDYLFWLTRKNTATGDLEVWRATGLGTGTLGTPVSRTCP